ncbi:MAG: hypothetical protein NT094_04700 [Candidatus Staskawiczbacteria bacterium]|nr:hypothetical protein [Candidatus Staskawiczbacteria bacterium]
MDDSRQLIWIDKTVPKKPLLSKPFKYLSFLVIILAIIIVVLELYLSFLNRKIRFSLAEIFLVFLVIIVVGFKKFWDKFYLYLSKKKLAINFDGNIVIPKLLGNSRKINIKDVESISIGPFANIVDKATLYIIIFSLLAKAWAIAPLYGRNYKDIFKNYLIKIKMKDGKTYMGGIRDILGFSKIAEDNLNIKFEKIIKILFWKNKEI